MSQEHEVDKRNKLPEEKFPAKSEHNGAAVEKRHRDGEADKRHHPRHASPELRDKPLGEREATICVDYGRDEEQEVRVT